MRFTKKIKRKVWAAFTVVAMLAGSMSVIAAEPDDKSDDSAYGIEADGGVLCDDGYVEYIEYPSSDDDLNEMVYLGSVNVGAKGSGNISGWSIATGHSATSTIFKAYSGGTISVAVSINPGNKTVKVGIVQPDGTRRYVSGSGAVGHDFSLTQSGNYRVYIANDSGTTVTATGGYTY